MCECPICESPCSEEITKFVLNELYKMSKNPNYKPKNAREAGLL